MSLSPAVCGIRRGKWLPILAVFLFSATAFGWQSQNFIVNATTTTDSMGNVSGFFKDLRTNTVNPAVTTIVLGDTIEWDADNQANHWHTVTQSGVLCILNASFCSPSGFGNPPVNFGNCTGCPQNLVPALNPSPDPALKNAINSPGTYYYYCQIHTFNPNLSTGMMGEFIVQPWDPNNPTHFSVSSPGSVNAGANFTVTVTALDRNNNIVKDYNGSATLSLPNSVGTLTPATVNFSGGQGQASTTASIQTSGVRTIHAANGGITGDGFVNVIAGAGTQLTVSASGTASVGNNFNYTVTSRDQFGNVAPSYAATVTFSSVSDPSALFTPASSTLLNGFGTFGVTFDAAGLQDITATDGTLTGTTNVTVSPSDCLFPQKSFPSAPAANGISFVGSDTICFIICVTLVPASSTPNPSQIMVSLPDPQQVVGRVTVSVNGFKEAANSANAGLMLVGPGGQSLILMSGAGNTAATGLNFTFDDSAGNGSLPQNSALVGGAYQPTDYSTFGFLSPAPTNPSLPAPAGVATLSSTFLGTNPNGVWSLYAIDGSTNQSSGSIDSWSLTITPAYSFTNSSNITINDATTCCVGNPATPYPSTIPVSGLLGDIDDVAVTLNGFSHSFPEDVSVLLVGPSPGNLAFLPMSHTGGGGPGESNITFVLDDFGGTQVPDANFQSSMYKPVAIDNGITVGFPAPAPGSWATPAPVGAATFGSIYNGTDPNGTWSLYVIDDDPADSGSISGGWTLTFRLKCPALTICQVQSGANPSIYNQPVTFTSTVSSPSGPGTPTGSATFNDLDSATVLGTVALDGAGRASLPFSGLTAGTHHISVDYSDGITFHKSTSTAVAQVVNQATTVTVMASSVNPTTYNLATIFTAKVTPAFGGLPTGTVTFTDTTSGTVLGTVPLNSLLRGILTYSALSVGTHSITATYNGDGNYTGSTSPVKVQVVDKAPSSGALGSSLNPSTFGAPVALTATISSANGGTPTGNITFMDGPTVLGTSSLNGSQTSLLVSTLSVGSHNLTAVYSGDGNFLSSTSPVLAQTVNQAATTTTVTSGLNPSTFGQTVTFNANVTSSGGTATGTVTFLDGATTLGTANLVNHHGSLTTSALTGGTHSITVTYSGDPSFAPSTSTVLMQTVSKTNVTVTLISSRPFVRFRQATTLTVTVTSPISTPTGTVTFRDNGKAFSVRTLVNGTAGGTLTFGAVGLHTLTADYNGDTNYNLATSNAIDEYRDPRPKGDTSLPDEQ